MFGFASNVIARGESNRVVEFPAVPIKSYNNHIHFKKENSAFLGVKMKVCIFIYYLPLLAPAIVVPEEAPTDHN